MALLRLFVFFALTACTTARSGDPERDPIDSPEAPARVQSIVLHAAAAQPALTGVSYAGSRWIVFGSSFIDFPVPVPVGCTLQSWEIRIELAWMTAGSTASLLAFQDGVETVVNMAAPTWSPGPMSVGVRAPVVVDARSFVLRFLAAGVVSSDSSYVYQAAVEYACP